MRIESSIITSLSELRAIEQQRIADERAAIERDRAAAIESVRAAERAQLEAEQQRVRLDREERMRIETARAEAEREIRLRLEAEQNAERMRLTASLDAQRLVEEIALRRAEVAKKRPTWMLVVTGVAAIAAVALTLFAIDSSNESEKARAQQATALREKEEAKQTLREISQRFRVLQADIEKFDGELTLLQKKLLVAQTTADRKRVADEIAAADQRKADARTRLAAEEARLEYIKRHQIIDVSKCINNPTGCLPHE